MVVVSFVDRRTHNSCFGREALPPFSSSIIMSCWLPCNPEDQRRATQPDSILYSMSQDQMDDFRCLLLFFRSLPTRIIGLLYCTVCFCFGGNLSFVLLSVYTAISLYSTVQYLAPFKIAVSVQLVGQSTTGWNWPITRTPYNLVSPVYCTEQYCTAESNLMHNPNFCCLLRMRTLMKPSWPGPQHQQSSNIIASYFCVTYIFQSISYLLLVCISNQSAAK